MAKNYHHAMTVTFSRKQIRQLREHFALLEVQALFRLDPAGTRQNNRLQRAQVRMARGFLKRLTQQVNPQKRGRDMDEHRD